jgi:hypothetical protein
MYWGLVFNNGWSSISNTPDGFYKPSLGGGVRLDYYFTKNMGLSLGVNFQQRGTGLKTPDYDSSLGNADSTNRLRLRFNCLDLPVSFLYRSNALFGGKGVKLILGAGITPQFNLKANRIFISAEDGFHDIQDVSKDYYAFDAPLNASAGFLVNAGNSSAFLVDLFAQFGLVNVYEKTSQSGQNRYFGIRIAWLF